MSRLVAGQFSPGLAKVSLLGLGLLRFLKT